MYSGEWRWEKEGEEGMYGEKELESKLIKLTTHYQSVSLQKSTTKPYISIGLESNSCKHLYHRGSIFECVK